MLDADDRLAPGALAALRAPLDADPRLGFAFGTMRFFGDWEGELRFPPYDPYALLYRHTIGLSALVRRQLIEATGGFDPAFEQFEDWELWVNALAHGLHGERVPVVVLEYRKHDMNKQGVDRRRYRAMYHQLRAKHAGLYARADELAQETGASLPTRLVYEYVWGLRPLPARVEAALQSLARRQR